MTFVFSKSLTCNKQRSDRDADSGSVQGCVPELPIGHPLHRLQTVAQEFPGIHDGVPLRTHDAECTCSPRAWGCKRSADPDVKTRLVRSSRVLGGSDACCVDDGDWLIWCCFVHCYYGSHHSQANPLGIFLKLK